MAQKHALHVVQKLFKFGKKISYTTKFIFVVLFYVIFCVQVHIFEILNMKYANVYNAFSIHSVARERREHAKASQSAAAAIHVVLNGSELS